MAGPAQIPTGTVTLLFTDIEGSTRLWEAEPEAMAVALRRHDEILRGSIEAAGGYVFKTAGDAFCAAFPTARAALDAVLAAQRLLAEQDWPVSRPVLVRMGVHTGACEERDGDYFGPVVNRAARLEAIAHGGQVLLSGATAGLLREGLPPDVSLRDLGLHRLKDLGRPEQVCQLQASFLQPDFPPLASLDNPELPNNLPSLLSPFVGREQELAEVRDLLRDSRLVTLTGAGGSGKTRLALQAAAEQLGAGADGVWLADLAPVTDGERIPAVVAGAIGLPDKGEQPAAELVTRALSSQDVLIVLDNCEHLIDAAAKFCDQVGRQCAKVRFLATSQEPLGLEGERAYRVPSLSLPSDDAERAADLATSDAVRLFSERARSTDPRFTITDQTAPLVASICRRLDGIPLALELAAARLSSMSLAQVHDRLDQRFRLLTGGSRNATPRQQTLRATVDWSFGLLRPAEREILPRLSVFAGGFDLAAAEQVCASDTVDAFDVLDLVGSLVDKSLVVADRDSAGESVRFRLLETIRQYGAAELLRTGGDDAVGQLRDRHADYFLGLARTASPELIGPAQGQWLRRLDAEWENLRVALAHLEARGRIADVLSLGAVLERFVQSRGHVEVLLFLERAITAAEAGTPGAVPPDVLAAGYGCLSWLGHFVLRTELGGPARLVQYARRALALARQAGDSRLEARALGMCRAAISDQESADRLRDEALAIARASGDTHLLGEVLGSFLAGPAESQLRARTEALECFRATGDDLAAAAQLSMISGLHLRAGRLDEAHAALRQAIEIAEPLGDEVFLFLFRCDMMISLLLRGDYAQAAPMARRCLLVARRIGLVFAVAEVLFAEACCTAWRGELGKAARLHGAAEAAIVAGVADHTISWSAIERALQESEQGRLREQLGEAAYAAAHEAGRRMSAAAAVDFALAP